MAKSLASYLAFVLFVSLPLYFKKVMRVFDLLIIMFVIIQKLNADDLLSTPNLQLHKKANLAMQRTLSKIESYDGNSSKLAHTI